MPFSHRTLLAVVLVASIAQAVFGQVTTTAVVQRSVGGVSIDAAGLLSNATVDDQGALGKLRTESLEKISSDLNSSVELRKISLRRLEAVLNECAAGNKPIPDTVKYLAGLQHIRYIFVYPEQKDIVLVGPGEGWKIDAKGNLVGIVTGRPVMLLDDLLVALRTARAAANGGIACSIDPTAEGLSRMQQELPALRKTGDAQTVAEGLEKALGMQNITVRGVSDTSHFARVLVGADYRMKRIAMNFEPSPVHGLPSYLQMVKPSARAVLSPRFWLEPAYDALLRDADGLAFELRGSSVKAMTEEDFVAAGGKIEHTGKATPAAKKWASLMTQKYSELAVADPIFGQLQNCMELAVVGALIVKERLADKAGHSMTTLFESDIVKPEAFNAPKQVKSIASVVNRSKSPVISASGGVAIESWVIADTVKRSDGIAPLRIKAAAPDRAAWWWN